MPSNYGGNDANYPNEIQLPSDGDPTTAASVNAAFEGLADRTAWLSDQRGLKRDLIATPGAHTWTPHHSGPVTIVLVGGGGGGGGGAGADAVAGHHGGGGAGGGGARANVVELDVVAETVYSIYVGNGGAIGVGGGVNVNGSAGGNGEDTSINNGPELALARGAQGGAGGLQFGSGNVYASGGLSFVTGAAAIATATDPSTTLPLAIPAEGQGGWGVHISGAALAAGFREGGPRSENGGGVGADLGGKGGGGGGASGFPASAAGAGGDGGPSDTAGSAGTAGTHGAGGGGGGGGGAVSVTGPAAGGSGGRGGDGAVLIIYQGPQATVT